MGFGVAVKNYKVQKVLGGYLHRYIAQTAVGNHKAHRFDKQRELLLHMWKIKLSLQYNLEQCEIKGQSAGSNLEWDLAVNDYRYIRCRRSWVVICTGIQCANCGRES